MNIYRGDIKCRLELQIIVMFSWLPICGSLLFIRKEDQKCFCHCLFSYITYHSVQCRLLLSDTTHASMPIKVNTNHKFFLFKCKAERFNGAEEKITDCTPFPAFTRLHVCPRLHVFECHACEHMQKDQDTII